MSRLLQKLKSPSIQGVKLVLLTIWEPKKGEVYSAYMDVAKKFEITPANVRTIIRRAIDKGWEGDLNPFGDEHERLHIINRSKRDRT
jgi:hypothetical protein